MWNLLRTASCGPFVWRGFTRFLRETCAGPLRVHGAILAGPRLSTCVFASPLYKAGPRGTRAGPFCHEFTLLKEGERAQKRSPALEVCGSCFLSVGLFPDPRGPLRVLCILAWVHASPALAPCRSKR